MNERMNNWIARTTLNPLQDQARGGEGGGGGGGGGGGAGVFGLGGNEVPDSFPLPFV